MNAAVIGGGFAGLAAAWELVTRGADVTLYESSSHAGGRVRSDVLEEHVLDASVQLFVSSFHTLFALLRAAGAADRLVRAPGRDAVRRNGRIHTVTYGSITSMLASGTLSARLKLKLGAKYLPYLARHARGLDVNSVATTGGAALDVESAAAFGRRELGDEFVDVLAHPLLAAYYGTPASEASAALLHGLAVAGMDVEVYAARNGVGELAQRVIDALVARGAKILFDARVDAVTATDTSTSVQLEDGTATHDVTVVAVPATEARRLLVGETALDTWLSHVIVRPAVTLGLALERPLPVDYFGLSFPQGDPLARDVAAVCVQRNKRTGRTRIEPSGDALVVMPSPAAAQRLAGVAASNVVAALLPPLEQVYPGITSRVVRARTYRFEAGYTVFYAGYVQRLAGFEADSTPARLALAGDYLQAPTVEGAARSGVAAARRLLHRAGRA
jgi:protoporphyrinogen/coproporphyrinogen III oxidase